PASDGGSPITGYTVTSSPGGVTADAGAGATSVAVTGLSNGTSYTFTVVSNNAVGPSAASAPSNAVTPATVPDAPPGVTAVAGNGQATVSWSTPASDGGSPITGYTVTSSPGGVTADAGAGATSVVVPGLTNGVAYNFTVLAKNAVGASDPSAPSNAVTPKLPATRLLVTEDSIPDGAQDFAFTGSAALGSFSLDDDPGDATLPRQRVLALAPGSYSLVEGAV